MPSAVVDLFCGVGGLTHGLQLAGLNVIAGIDFEESCRYAYEQNNNADFIQRDITTITANEVNELFPENTIKVLAGCAPCQPFSKYTSRYRKDGYQDDKWRLLYYFGNLIEEIQPEIIAMENVPELRSTDVFSDFVNKLNELNYHVWSSVVFCPDYGVPQNRKRLVLLASNIGNISLIPPTHSSDDYVTVRDVISQLPVLQAGQVDDNDSLHTSTRLSEKNLRRMRASVPGGTWRDWPKELQLKCHKKDSGTSYPSVYGRMEWDKPSPTITTQFYGYGNGRFGHPEQDRAISLREGAILQSFPANYEFVQNGICTNKRKLGVQIGNAVPVELGRAIGVSILNHLEVYNNG